MKTNGNELSLAELTSLARENNNLLRQIRALLPTGVRGRAPRFGIDTQEAVHAIWASDQKNPMVLGGSNTRPSYRLSFQHSKALLAALGITTPEDYRQCLRARTNRLSYQAIKRLA